jgi:hypothetical protein
MVEDNDGDDGDNNTIHMLIINVLTRQPLGQLAEERNRIVR